MELKKTGCLSIVFMFLLRSSGQKLSKLLGADMNPDDDQRRIRNIMGDVIVGNSKLCTVSD